MGKDNEYLPSSDEESNGESEAGDINEQLAVKKRRGRPPAATAKKSPNTASSVEPYAMKKPKKGNS